MSSPEPSVEFELPERRGIGTVSLIIAVLGAASVVGWWLGAAPEVDASMRLILGAAAVAALVPALLCARRDLPARLRHDGQDWWLSSSADEKQPAQQGRIQVVFDLQAAMLLRFEAANGQWSRRIQWLAVSRGDLDPRWHEWRGVVIAAAARGHAPPLSGVDTAG